MKEIVIDMKADGKVEGMHFDEFDLGFLGNKHVSRASEIFYNEETQMWDIILPGHDHAMGASAAGFSGYDVARKFEVLWLQECRKRQLSPATSEGYGVAVMLRQAENLSKS